ncbi:MAG: helicase, partial [Planctomycetota bacterium]
WLVLHFGMTGFVKYFKNLKEKPSHTRVLLSFGFLMILMQRLVVSSTTAIRTTLERRLEALETPQEQLSLFPIYSDDEWADLDGQEQIETLLTTSLKALKNERAEVKLLLEAATRCMQLRC